ncbi:MAG TPA: MauE/DoxX family redox-associated membrane protein [Chthoniobacterales bacterium]|nr:MauE/DoxX family redox-associated membrane protein [Chthoniobacterales bacterium]
MIGYRLLVIGYLRSALRVLLAALFVLAGGLKVLDPAAFAVEISRYQLIPWWSCAILALFLPWLEICVGIVLLTPWFSRGGLAWSAALLIVFSIALLSAMLRGLSIDCGCFGRVWQSTGTFWPLVRNLVLLAIIGFLWWQPHRL